MNDSPPPVAELHVIVFECAAGVPVKRLFTIPCMTLPIAATIAENETETKFLGCDEERPAERVALLFSGKELWGWYREGREQVTAFPADKFAKAKLGDTQFTLSLPLRQMTVAERRRAPEHRQGAEPVRLQLSA